MGFPTTRYAVAAIAASLDATLAYSACQLSQPAPGPVPIVASSTLPLALPPHHGDVRSRSSYCLMSLDATLELTFDDVRKKTVYELEDVVEWLEAENMNVMDESGKPSAKAGQLLAIAHTCTGDYELAVPYARAAIAEGGAAPAEMAEMHFVLGLGAEKREEEDTALEEYDAAVALDPKCWRALFHVGKLSLRFGYPADAFGFFQQVAAINPTHAPTQAFVAKLAEAGITEEEEVDDWWRAEAAKEQGSSDDDAPPELPESMQGFKLDQ